MANGIIGLDNITNIASGLDKELLDMTYSDKYYRDVIQPAKLGKGPMPSRMEMIGQSLRNFGPVKAMFIGAQPGKYGERAMPTKPAQKFLNTLGDVAKFGIKRATPFFSFLGSTELGADDVITPEMRDKVDITDELDDYYEKGEMMPNVEDARRSLLERILELGQGLGGGIVDAAKGAGNVLSNLGIVGALKNFDNFKNLSPLDQQFILSQAGGNRPMKDAFGYNIRSARGNYADLVSRRAQIARNRALFKQPLRAIDLYYQKKEAERAEKERDILNKEFAAGRGGSGQDFTGGRYDGARDAATYSAEPTAYSGSS